MTEPYFYQPLANHFIDDSLLSIEQTLIKEISSNEKSYLIQDNSTTNHDEPLIKFVDHIIANALQQSASDIHIEPYATCCRIRYRRDGILYNIMEIAAPLATRLATRLKVMAKLDITERRLPQDGRFQWNAIEIRMNTCPIQQGEKVVLRLLDINKISLKIDTLGLTSSQQQIFLNKISAPSGLILVTGPTGSGKTITLYSALHYLNTHEKNISTVEDPVEIQLSGINQVSIHPKIGLDFAAVLRTLLRQDPDIIMIGEIRDKETAHIAIQAAETGHLVLSTLHTNSALETINRFKSMGISMTHFINALSLIIGQRLIRILCQHCKQSEEIPSNHLGLSSDKNNQLIYRAKGCEHCLQGYQGRTGIYEFFSLTDTMIECILSNASHTKILATAQASGYTPLWTTAMNHILNGTTSMDEIQRVL